MKEILLLGVAFLISGNSMVANQNDPNYTLGDLIWENGYVYDVDENDNTYLWRIEPFDKLLKEKNGTVFDLGYKANEVSEVTTQVEEKEKAETETEAEVVEPEVLPEVQEAYLAFTNWTGPKLNRSNGTINGPSGKETYYNLPMQGVISIMRSLGYSSPEYDYWVREDGVKMFGPYIMCAADLGLRPKGTIVPTSLGVAMVCDTGSFAYSNHYQLDIAVAW